MQNGLGFKQEGPRGSGQTDGDCLTSTVTLVTGSPVFAQLLEMARRIAPSDAAVLIQGESGTGKELLARYIHAHSQRAQRPMMAMNCAALPEQLAESELFGYEKGAFTGAVQTRPGRFEAANGSTLLLDEISEMQLSLQAKLLRTLQEKQVDRVGGRRPVSIDVRIMATTNRDLETLTRAGSFREDLFYRLRVIPIILPPLRQRPEDIPLLIKHFTKKYCPAHLKDIINFSPATLSLMTRWSWPGNVRELENTVYRALLMSPGSEITPDDLYLTEPTEPTADDAATADTANAGTAAGTAHLVGMTVKELEKRLIEQTLTHLNQNRTQAAKMLGISIRTLRNKLQEFKTDTERI